MAWHPEGFEEAADYCRCQEGFSGVDCAEEMLPLPQVPQLRGAPQYVPGDSSFGDANPVFDVEKIAQLRVEVSQADLDSLMNPLKINARDYKPARLAFANGAIQRAFSGVGIRVKGASSRGYVKKSFRISLDEFSADEPSFYGQKTLLLKATAMNPDWTRERLSAYLLKAMGTPVQRMSFATLYINGMYRGVYQLMENIDKGFLMSRYGNSTGALWKCEPNAAFLNHGRSCSQYLDNYEPQTPLAESSCQPLIFLIEVINSPPSPDFEDRLERLLDVDAFLAAYSTEILSANWDGVRNSKNFWLYLPDSSSRFSYFRADPRPGLWE